MTIRDFMNAVISAETVTDEMREFAMNEIITLYNISIRTFRRYIAEINNFLYEQYKHKEVIFSKERGTYYIVEF